MFHISPLPYLSTRFRVLDSSGFPLFDTNIEHTLYLQPVILEIQSTAAPLCLIPPFPCPSLQTTHPSHIILTSRIRNLVCWGLSFLFFYPSSPSLSNKLHTILTSRLGDLVGSCFPLFDCLLFFVLGLLSC